MADRILLGHVTHGRAGRLTLAQVVRIDSVMPFGTGVVKQDLGTAFRLAINPDDLDGPVAWCRASNVSGRSAKSRAAGFMPAVPGSGISWLSEDS